VTPARALLLSAAGLVLVMARTNAMANVESGDAIGTISGDALMESMGNIINRLTEQPAGVDEATAQRNLSAALITLQLSEGTRGHGADPYRVCYGFAHTIGDMGEHPAITGEWRGERLSDQMCSNAGFAPGCISTAAGAYQLIKPTWIEARDALSLRDFSGASQDAAAAYFFRRAGALQDVYAGRVASWVAKVRGRWASLPGNYAKQGQRSLAELASWYTANGGTYA
jgi:muramidase (phage lysozyme)